MPGAKAWPRRLRSDAYPAGLPNLTGGLRQRVMNSNSMTRWVAALAERLHAQGRGFVVENPKRSYMWQLPEMRRLSAQRDVRAVHLHNCVHGGARRKHTTFLTNLKEMEALAAVCADDRVCTRTGHPHALWRPVVQNGVIIGYPTEEEAEYPEQLCRSFAEVVAKVVAKEEAQKEGSPQAVVDFLEIFSGPRAPLTSAVRDTRRGGVREGPEEVGKVRIEEVMHEPAHSQGATTGQSNRPSGRRTEQLDLVRVGRWGNGLVTLQELRQEESGQRRDDDLVAPLKPGA